MDSIVAEVNRTLSKVGKVARLSLMGVKVGFDRLELLAPVHIGIREIEMRPGSTAPRLVGIRQQPRACHQCRRELPNDESGKRVSELWTPRDEIGCATRAQNVKHGKHGKQMSIADAEV